MSTKLKHCSFGFCKLNLEMFNRSIQHLSASYKNALWSLCYTAAVHCKTGTYLVMVFTRVISCLRAWQGISFSSLDQSCSSSSLPHGRWLANHYAGGGWVAGRMIAHFSKAQPLRFSITEWQPPLIERREQNFGAWRRRTVSTFWGFGKAQGMFTISDSNRGTRALRWDNLHRLWGPVHLLISY